MVQPCKTRRATELPRKSTLASPPVDCVPEELLGRASGVRSTRLQEDFVLDAEQLGDMIAQGAHPKYIQAQLGHASIQTTLDRYGHLMPQLHQAEAQKLDELVFGAAGRVAGASAPGGARRAAGATRLQMLRFGVLPQVLPLFLSYVLYRLETNIRAATVLGFIGAGGIGFYLQTYLRMIDYPAASTVLLVTVAMVMIVDGASSRLRDCLV